MIDRNIHIRTVPKNKIRNNGVGDYYEKDGDIHILSADLSDTDAQFLIRLHEFIEEYLTRRDGIDEPLINQFDAIDEINKEIKKLKDQLNIDF